MTRRNVGIRILVWAPSSVEVVSGLLLAAFGQVDTWTASAPDTYVGTSVAVWPAGLVLLGVGALGFVVAGLFEAVNLVRR